MINSCGPFEHNGGIRFRAGGTSVSLRNFTYTIGRRSTLSAQVGSSRLTILNLNLGKAEVGGDGPLTKTASGIRATLTAGAARALNRAFRTRLFRAGLKLGTVRTSIDLADAVFKGGAHDARARPGRGQRAAAARHHARRRR